MAVGPGDLVNGITSMVQQFVRDRREEFKIVTELSMLLGKVECARDIGFSRNILCIYEEEIIQIHEELREYIDGNKNAIIELFPALKPAIESYVQENPFDPEPYAEDDEFFKYLEFDGDKRSDMEKALRQVLFAE